VRLACLAVIAAAVACATAAAPASSGPINGFSLLATGPDGGALWQGVIRDTVVPRAKTVASVVYLPPGFSTTARYPVVYVLHGLPGSPYSVSGGMDFAGIADRLIASGAVQPFVAVVPAGPPPRYDGEWAGPWERFLLDEVVPWSEVNLPVEDVAAGRTLAGYSAGGFGAIDIGLRHSSTFGTLESWSGYFDPPRDGPFRSVSDATLRANDPSAIVQQDAAALRQRHVRIFLSVGSTHDRWTEARTMAFAAELRLLAIPYRLWLAPGGHDGKFWRRQLAAALEFANPFDAARQAGR
jgi:enterochelin esterase-like enzyme